KKKKKKTTRMDVAVKLMTRFVKKTLHQYTMYPVNTLRNIALTMSKSNFVFLVDVDFIPSNDLHDQVIRSNFFKDFFFSQSNQYLHPNKSHVGSRPNVALVIPAFELVLYPISQSQSNLANRTSVSMAWNMSDVNTTPKFVSQISQLFLQQQARAFHGLRCSHCHGPTNYPKWAQMVTNHSHTNATKDFYSIAYYNNYEPYIIVPRKGLRMYDERFQGYGLNKVMQIKMLAQLELFDFFVYTNGFLVAKEHGRTVDDTNWATDPKKRKYIEWLGHQVDREIAQGIGTPVIY
ncbi:hypothetical protein RFI_06892, partial [Reticulomyxa filosa]